MQTREFLFLWVLILPVFGGCATLISGSNQKILVQSEPSGAIVKDNGVPVGKTPCTIMISRGLNHEILLELEGYKQQAIDLQGDLNPITLLNILNLGIGFGVDFLTGAYLKREPKEIYTILRPIQNPSSTKEDGNKVDPEKIPDPFVPK